MKIVLELLDTLLIVQTECKRRAIHVNAQASHGFEVLPANFSFVPTNFAQSLFRISLFFLALSVGVKNGIEAFVFVSIASRQKSSHNERVAMENACS